MVSRCFRHNRMKTTWTHLEIKPDGETFQHQKDGNVVALGQRCTTVGNDTWLEFCMTNVAKGSYSELTAKQMESLGIKDGESVEPPYQPTTSMENAW